MGDQVLGDSAGTELCCQVSTFLHAAVPAEYADNLRFFVKHGIRQGDYCDYIIVIQQA